MEELEGHKPIEGDKFLPGGWLVESVVVDGRKFSRFAGAQGENGGLWVERVRASPALGLAPNFLPLLAHWQAPSPHVV
jgi:hypothetical protein